MQIDGETKKRYWVGQIFNVKIINENEAIQVYNKYLKKGWIDSMEEQIRLSEANAIGFSNWKGINLFNVKFRLTDVKFEKYIELPISHPVYKISRYSFSHFKDDININVDNIKMRFTFIPPYKIGDRKVTKLSKKFSFVNRWQLKY